MKILAIETSCDETSIAIVDAIGPKKQPRFHVLAHLVSSQIKLHAKFGGVVPNLAKREHQRLLVPLLLKALKKAGLYRSSPPEADPPLAEKLECKNKSKVKEILNRESDLFAIFEKKIFSLSVPDIDVIAVTNGPGLAPALWVGVNFAKALALIWNKPIIPMNHMKGHLYAAFVQDSIKISQEIKFPAVRFPVIALLVSGGHTELVLMKKFGSYKIIGETLDDAAGEAFDKVARMLNLGYPGGPAISTTAEKKFKVQSSPPEADPPSAEKFKVNLPRPMISSKDYNFSFSGLKTAVLYFIRDLGDKKSVLVFTPTIAKEFQDAVVDVLVAKTIRAAKQYHAKTIIVGGGVSANKLLGERLSTETKKLGDVDLFIPDRSLTGDNALMIALAAFIDGKKKTPNQIGAEANLRFSDK